ASNTGVGDAFGYSVAISGDGNTLAVGTPSENSNATGIDGDESDNTATDAGAVYVFSRSGSSWSQQAYVKASNTGAYDSFGYSVAISDDGNTLAVGAYSEDSNATGIDGAETATLSNSGAVYVFSRSVDAWSQQAYVKASNTGAADEFGNSVAISGDGNTLAVGAHFEASMATGINGDEADDTANSAGAVYVFSRTGITWSQQAYVKASNTETTNAYDDEFGWSVALSEDGNTLAVGAVWEDSIATGIDGDESDNTATDAGAVYVFTRSAGSWAQQAYVKATNPEEWVNYGTSVSLSDDGNALAVGAPFETSVATGVNGDQTGTTSFYGAVYLY
ncbi:MAG: FG-GAP repeat protein, partial [Gammaproteobacteria bacterium]|nr:FG-GAP repeat protein [Gammaproteobacteria bacterium]